MRVYFIFLTVLVLLGFSYTAFPQRARSNVSLILQGKIFKDKRPLPDAIIKVVDENGYDIISTSTVKTGSFKLKLPLNNEYTITIKYPYCYDKIIDVSTKMKDRGSWVNWFFEFNVDMVELFPDKEALPTMAQPIARIQYHGKMYGFDYDLEYTDRMQNQMQKELRVAEIETPKQERYAYLNALKKQDGSRYEEERAKRIEEQEAREENVRERRQAELKDMFAKAKEKRRNDSLARAEADQRRKLEAEKAKLIKKEAFVLPTETEDTEETYTDGNKTITRKVFVREGKASEYKKVTYTFGGILYFRNGENITESVYNQEISDAQKNNE